MNPSILTGAILVLTLLQATTAGPAEPRSISGLFKSKLGDLYKLRDNLEESPEVPNAQDEASASAQNFKMFPQDDGGSDTIFQSLSELFDDGDKVVAAKEVPLSDVRDMDKDLPKPNAYQFAEEDMQERGPTPAEELPIKNLWEESPDVVRGDYFGNNVGNLTYVSSGVVEEQTQEYWTRIKGIVGNMKSILEQMYPPHSDNEKKTFAIFDKAIAFGDNMNVLNKIRKTFDSELLGFLGQKWVNIKDGVVNGSPLLKFILSLNTKGITKNFMLSLIQQLGHLLHQQAFTHLSEMDFVTELMRSSGFKDLEIHQVFQLLDLPTDAIDNDLTEAEARQLGNLGYSGYNIEKSGGYGHSGGGGYGGGGGYMQSFDPFVLLAGLAFATFLAYLLYRLLSSTTGRKRDIPDISLALDLSDLPDVVGNLYSWLEKTEEKYGGNEYHGDLVEEVIDESESFGSAANTLWSSFQADRLSHSCVKRYICDYASKSSKKMMGHGAILEQLALTALAQLFGEEEGAKMMDEVQSDYLSGKEGTCSARASDCDDVTYESVVTTRPKPEANLTSTDKASSAEFTATISSGAISYSDQQ